LNATIPIGWLWHAIWYLSDTRKAENENELDLEKCPFILSDVDGKSRIVEEGQPTAFGRRIAYEYCDKGKYEQELPTNLNNFREKETERRL